MGDDFDNRLDDPDVPNHMGAKSRWIIQGFHDPDTHLLVRTVPTPATSDVPFACQLLSSMRARAFVADVRLLPKVSRDSGLIVSLLCYHPVDFLEKRMKTSLSNFWQKYMDL